jgi:phenylalanyl-tRNA synthetase beta subunit
LAGIVYNKKSVDFYEVKQHLEALCAAIGHAVTWRENKKKPWWSHMYKVVDAYAGGHYVGTLGQLSEQLTAHFTKGQVVCFELYLEPLLQMRVAIKKAQSLPAHQFQSLDVSCMIHQSVTTEELIKVISGVDSRIVKVSLIDSYHKSDWKDKKSMTLRCVIYGVENVLSKEELEKVLHHIQIALEGHGAEVR